MSSGLPLKADLARRSRHFAKVPQADMALFSFIPCGARTLDINVQAPHRVRTGVRSGRARICLKPLPPQPHPRGEYQLLEFSAGRKFVELLKTIAPDTKRFAVFEDPTNPTTPNSGAR
jgi:hypothetical protein